MLVNLKEILDIAEKGGFAVPAFNVYNMETVMGAIEAAEEAKAPVILQSYSRLFKEGSAFYLAPIILKAAETASVPVCFHLDHGAGELEVTRALRYGCTGIMIDASALDFEDNIAMTKKIVDTCGYLGVPVEGRTRSRRHGKRHLHGRIYKRRRGKTFVEKTGVAALAVLVGTAHGRYKKPPKLDIERIADIKKATRHTPCSSRRLRYSGRSDSLFH